MEQLLGFLKCYFQKKAQTSHPKTPIPSIKTDLNNLPKNKNWFIWFGHSSYLLNLNGKIFLIDPVFTRATPLPFGGNPYQGTDIYQPSDMPKVDYLIITHDHYDHLDYHTITAIKNNVGQIIMGLGVGAHLERWGIDDSKIIELDWYENIQLGKFNITALPTRHFSGRRLKRNQSLWASFMISSDFGNVYVGGDGGYDVFYKDIKQKFGDIDLAILENGQYNKNWANIHFMPDDLIKAINDLNPQKIIPVHNSKFTLAYHAWNEPLIKLFTYAKQHHLPLYTPKIGEVFYLDEEMTFDEWWIQ